MLHPPKPLDAPTAPAGFRRCAVLDAHALGFVFQVERAGGTFICKRLRGRGERDTEATRQLLQEGAILAALDGRGVPKLASRGDDDAGPFVVMEFVMMASLTARAVIDASWMACAAPQAFATLATVHEAVDALGPLEIVHADISPSNLLVRDDGGDAKLIDFGLSRWRATPPWAAAGEATSRATAAFQGTLLYAAPELARGEEIDARADLFALAASLLHSYARAPPRRATVAPAMLVEAGEADVVDWARAASAGLPRVLANALCACVAFDRNARPSAARDVTV